MPKVFVLHAPMEHNGTKQTRLIFGIWPPSLGLRARLVGPLGFCKPCNATSSKALSSQCCKKSRDTSLGGFNPKKHLRIIPWLPFHPIIPFPCLKMKHPFKHIRRHMKMKHCPILPSSHFIEGSLEVKLPTIWTVEKQRWEESEEKRSEERRCRCAKR